MMTEKATDIITGSRIQLPDGANLVFSFRIFFSTVKKWLKVFDCAHCEER